MKYIILFIYLGVVSQVYASCSLENGREFWKSFALRELNASINSLLIKSRDEAVLNSVITQKYYELNDGTNALNRLNLISYIYSHASFHLGRIPRYRFWKKGDKYGIEDMKLIKGKGLRRLLKLNSTLASRNLMKYSKDLFLQLTWSLYAFKECGIHYTRSIVDDENLREFYQENDLKLMMNAFIRYEQTYLQGTLYSNFYLRPMIKTGLIDEMRWIPFAGEEWQSFRHWCHEMHCGSSSYHLGNRIKFDQTSIGHEIDLLEQYGLADRWNESYILFFNNYFLSTRV